MTRLKLIITDFDGVILNSEPAKDLAYKECFSFFPQQVDEFMSYHFENATVGRYEKFKYFYENILKIKYTDDCRKWISDRFNEIAYEKVCSSSFIPGALEFIKNFSKKLPIWIVTGTPKDELVRVLKKLDINKYFEKVFSTPPNKSEILSKVLCDANISSEETVFIGDMNNDLNSAKDNGIPFIGIETTEVFSGPRIAQIKDLKSIGSALNYYE